MVHQRTSSYLHLGEVEVALQVETRGAPHAERVLGHLRGCGYRVTEDAVEPPVPDGEGSGTAGP